MKNDHEWKSLWHDHIALRWKSWDGYENIWLTYTSIALNYFISHHHHEAIILRWEAKFSVHSCGFVLIYHVPGRTRLLSVFVWVSWIRDLLFPLNAVAGQCPQEFSHNTSFFFLIYTSSCPCFVLLIQWGLSMEIPYVWATSALLWIMRVISRRKHFSNKALQSLEWFSVPAKVMTRCDPNGCPCKPLLREIPCLITSLHTASALPFMLEPKSSENDFLWRLVYEGRARFLLVKIFTSPFFWR